MDLNKIFKIYDFEPTREQRKAIESINGPNLIIAGPGSGKSQVLLLRTVNLLLNYNVEPQNIILCTFTEKAASQLKERLSFLLEKLDNDITVHDIKCGTIHSICRSIIEDNIELSHFKNDFEILDEITQCLFLNENFGRLIEPLEFGQKYLYKWPINRKIFTINQAIEYLNKLTEENITISRLKESENLFHRSLGMLYDFYLEALKDHNKIDFPHLQKEALNILRNPRNKLDFSNVYLMVDEFQDTNHIQELIFFEITKCNKNICVVGDDDQGIYRFRGASVENILQFESKFEHTNKFTLNENFRSNDKIINVYNYFINSCDWTNIEGDYLRHRKRIKAGKNEQKARYPSSLSISVDTDTKEANLLASFVKFLMDNHVISDWAEVAILLKSVRQKYSDRFVEAFSRRGINVYCPRARGFFSRTEIELLIGCFHLIFKEASADLKDEKLKEYLTECEDQLLKAISDSKHDQKLIADLRNRLQTSEKSIARDVLEIFYDLIALDVFQKQLKDKNTAYNMGVMSQLIQKFQSYYHYVPFTKKKLDYFYLQFFASFLGFLKTAGINEYEDKEDALPKGHVHILTIHQSKGLEFPVVVVGTLSNKFAGTHYVDKELSNYYGRNISEPIEKYSLFDNMRLFYVAFSRAKHFLILLASKGLNRHFGNVLKYSRSLQRIDMKEIGALRFKPTEIKRLKRKLSLTGDITLYDTCPRQYQVFREYGFAPSSTAQFTVGILVHNTIEEVHKEILLNNTQMDKDDVMARLEENIRILKLSNSKILGKNLIENARNQISNYYDNFSDNFDRLVDCEQLIILEKEKFYLVGKVDLLTGTDEEIELIDFKAYARPRVIDDAVLGNYKKQLAVYNYQLMEKCDKTPSRNIIFFTGEKLKNNAILDVDITNYDIDQALKSFEQTANKILNKEYSMKKLPDFDEVCSQCDYKKVCYKK